MNFYSKQYVENNVYDTIEISPNDLKYVTQTIFDYFKNERNNLDVYVKINNLEKEFFNTKEKNHMQDVKFLFSIAFLLKKFLIINIFSLLILKTILKQKKWQNMFKTIRNFFSFSMIFFLFLILFIFSNFEKYFNLFHEIFFNNDLWILDPKTDLLINIVPLEFFINIFINILVVFFSFILVIILISHILSRRKNL